MNYLHSPSRYHNTSLTSAKSPLSLFDSPSYSGNRFSDQYQALSCESPPPNFDDLQTPLQAQRRRTLDWGLEINDRPSPSAPATTAMATATAITEGSALTDIYKRTPERSSAKLQSPLVTPERPTKAATERMNAALYHSPLNGAPLVKYELSPLAKKSSTPPQRENTSPLGNNTEQDNNLKKSPLGVYPSRVRRPLEYISSPVRNTVAPHDTTTSPLRKSPHYSTSTPTAPPPPNDQSPIDRSPYQQQRRRPSLPSVSSSSPLNTSPISQNPVIYRSPVYSNSSYKPIANRPKSLVDLPSPSTSTQQQQHSDSSPPPIQPTQRSSLAHLSVRSEQTVAMDTSHSSFTNKKMGKPPQPVPNVAPKSPVARYHDKLPHYMRATESYQSRMPTTTSTAPPSYPHQLHRKPSSSSISSHPGELPHYMRATESYQSRLQAQVDQLHHLKLHRTKSGGVVKRVRAPQQFQSSTKINAIDDIKNEMTPEDVYIPLAARVKLFEKGLGNSASSSSSSQNEQTTLWAQRVTKAKSPYLLTRERSATSSHHCHELDNPPPPPTSLNDRLAQTVDPPPKGTKRSRHASEDQNASHSKRAKHVKPFHFATDDRAARYQRNFKEKLNLWKQKDLKENK